MSDISTSRRRQQLLDKFLAGEIDKAQYDSLLAELNELSSASVVSASLIEEASSKPPSVIVASSDHESIGNTLQPIAVVGSGTKLGSFLVEKRLGRGGMGEVWRARDLVGERTVVVKLLHPEFVHHPDELASVKQMFQRVHNLQHQNICPLYLLGQDDRFGYYVVMKYLDGKTLSVYRRRYLETHSEFTLQELKRVLGPVAAALDYAHGHKIIHCDVKPQNIMISPDGQDVQLVDFGLAAEIRSTVSRLSSSSVEYGGTYPYMSPEQWRGEQIDGKTDQYALAVVAYEMIAGSRPFRSADPAVLRMCALNDDPSPIEGVDPAVNAALRRGMAKSKLDRFDSCTGFLECLCAGVEKPSSTASARGLELPTRPAERNTNAKSISDDGTDIGSVDSQHAAGRQDAGRRNQGPSKNARDSREQATDVLVTESPIERANRKAAFWVSVVGGLSMLGCLGLAIWFASGRFQSDPRTQIAESQTKLLDNGQSNPQPVVPASVESAAVAPTPAAPVEPLLRYRWQTDHAYVYSVNLDIDQDQDRVITYAGDLTYVAMPPSAPQAVPDQESQGTGTAFVIHPDGYLLTCHHVTEAATKLEVFLSGKTYPATVVIDDAVHDLAIIRIDARNLPSLRLANSDAVEQGEEVRAVGFPLSTILGENIKATRGTVSGINEDDGRKVFQIDASINPGNSGGPLVNEQGEVVGVIYAKLIDDVASGVGFATPVNDAKSLLKSQQISFADGQAGPKLDGPALVKEVSAATALVTVTSVGANHRSRGKVAVRCEGTLHPKSWKRSGLPGDSLGAQGSGHPIQSTSVGDGNDVDQVQTDSVGRIYAVTGRGNLPSFMGQTSRLIIEQLPGARQKTWSYSHRISLSIPEEQQPQDRFPFGPRFGPRGFGAGRFGLQGMDRRFEEVTTRELPADLRVEYVLGERTGSLQTIQKSFELKTDELVGERPRIHLKGQGKFVFNAETGLPHEMEFSAQLADNDPGKSSTTPIKLTYKFVEDRKLPARQGPSPVPSPIPVTATGKPVEIDSVVEVGRKLVGEWAGKWIPVKVLAVNADGTIRIHWEGWSDQWDEDVPRSRLRFPAK